MFISVNWFYRRVRQMRLACVLCLIVAYATLLLGSISIIAYFDQRQDQDALAPVSTTEELDLPRATNIVLVDARPKGKLNSTWSVLFNSTRILSELSPRTLVATPTLKPWNISKYPTIFAVWKQNRLNGCDGRMELYSREFARLRNVIVDRKFCVARAQGGEEVSKVLLQDENAEYYRQIKHCFQLECRDANGIFGYPFSSLNFLDNWMNNVKTADVQTDNLIIDRSFSIALERREYANLYHTMNDWYNIFLLMVFFEKRPNETNIVLVDAHPKGKLDPVWSILFNSTRMLSELSPRTLFTTMIWGNAGYNSVLKQPFQVNGDSPLLLEEFRMFFLDRFQLSATRQLNCSNVSVLFIWRHDYLAHPRNPLGLVQRKIDNEEELISALRGRHPNYAFRGVQIDAFEMTDQLRLVTEADILIGMHGAGLSHTLFVPSHGGMIELVPKYYGSENDHFFDLARHRGLALARWVNNNSGIEMGNYRTQIPVDMLDSLLKTVVLAMCTESPETRLERYRLQRQPDLQRGGHPVVRFRNRMEDVVVRRLDARPVERNRFKARRL